MRAIVSLYNLQEITLSATDAKPEHLERLEDVQLKLADLFVAARLLPPLFLLLLLREHLERGARVLHQAGQHDTLGHHLLGQQ
jgi:hypothetical protein